MATATTSQHRADNAGGVGEYSFAHLRIFFCCEMFVLHKWAAFTQRADS